MPLHCTQEPWWLDVVDISVTMFGSEFIICSQGAWTSDLNFYFLRQVFLHFLLILLSFLFGLDAGSTFGGDM